MPCVAASAGSAGWLGSPALLLHYATKGQCTPSHCTTPRHHLAPLAQVDDAAAYAVQQLSSQRCVLWGRLGCGCLLVALVAICTAYGSLDGSVLYSTHLHPPFAPLTPSPPHLTFPNHCSNSLYPFSLKKVGVVWVSLEWWWCGRQAMLMCPAHRWPASCCRASAACLPRHRECLSSWHTARYLPPPAAMLPLPTVLPSFAAFPDVICLRSRRTPAPMHQPCTDSLPHSCNCCYYAGAVRQAGAQRQRRRGAPPQAGAEPRHHARQHVRGKLGVGLCLVACASWCPAGCLKLVLSHSTMSDGTYEASWVWIVFSCMCLLVSCWLLGAGAELWHHG